MVPRSCVQVDPGQQCEFMLLVLNRQKQAKSIKMSRISQTIFPQPFYFYIFAQRSSLNSTLLFSDTGVILTPRSIKSLN